MKAIGGSDIAPTPSTRRITGRPASSTTVMSPVAPASGARLQMGTRPGARMDIGPPRRACSSENRPGPISTSGSSLVSTWAPRMGCCCSSTTRNLTYWPVSVSISRASGESAEISATVVSEVIDGVPACLAKTSYEPGGTPGMLSGKGSAGAILMPWAVIPCGGRPIVCAPRR